MLQLMAVQGLSGELHSHVKYERDISLASVACRSGGWQSSLFVVIYCGRQRHTMRAGWEPAPTSMHEKVTITEQRYRGAVVMMQVLHRSVVLPHPCVAGKNTTA